LALSLPLANIDNTGGKYLLLWEMYFLEEIAVEY